MKYNWQRVGWGCFQYELGGIEADLLRFVELAGELSGVLKALPKDAQSEMVLDLMLAEAIKTSEIEGEFLSRTDVMSSIRNHMGFNEHPEVVSDKASEGAGHLMYLVRKTWHEALTEETLFRWHTILMVDMAVVNVGAWRTHSELMQVVSGRIGKPTVHFEAPPSERVPEEMKRFLSWFKEGDLTIQYAPIRAAIAHLYFESIHPFEDGNGRIGRAIAEKALSQGLGRPVLLSLSRTIEANRKAYFKELESAQKSNEITGWLAYFVRLIVQSQRETQSQVDFILKKAKFFDRFANQLDKRQLRVVQRMIEAGPSGFEGGGMNARKYVSLTQVSKATATRDLQLLVQRGVLIPIGGGRSTRYQLNLNIE